MNRITQNFLCSCAIIPTRFIWNRNMEKRSYLCIDLKSFYASVECVERGLDPFKVNLVVADPERGNGTICLAVSPAMKALGVPGRCRVFEIPSAIRYIMAPPRMSLYMQKSTQIVGIYSLSSTPAGMTPGMAAMTFWRSISVLSGMMS